MHNLSASQIREKFVSGETSAVEIATYFLKRIEEHADLGAFLHILSERVLKKAQALDEKKAKGEPLGKLAGVPVALKDNMNMKGELTTCSSKFLSNYKAPFDATLTELLEAEDALIIGKTNLDEFAMGSSNEHAALGKVPLNPWCAGHTAGGSSGGSASAVAARLCPLSFGSDTGGSIRQPAALCGIYGYKPTYGRVSRYGLVAFASSLDQIGPFAHRASDIGLIMEVVGKHCPKDSTSLNIPPDTYSYGDIKGMKIGVPYSFIADLDPEMRKNFDSSIETLKSLGAEVAEVDLDILKYSVATYYILATAEASTNLARFDGVRYGRRSEKAKTLSDVYDLSKGEGFGPEVKRRILLGTYVLSSGFQDAYYKRAQKVRTLMIEAFNKAFEACDVVAMPPSPTPAWELGAIREPLQEYLADLYTIGANLAGIPAISCPSGFTDDGKPIGLQILGPQKADTRVIQVAAAFEGATPFAAQIPGGMA